ncbi:MAG: hypothetical protein LIP16_13235 [Clostridium sp.]|nr:hypothetical protein [Clostridium sp.]
MKGLTKRFAVLGMAAGLWTAGAFQAFGAGWQEDRGRWQYDDGTGTLKNQWKAIDGVSYYFGQGGYMMTDTITPDGYRVDGAGMVTYDKPDMTAAYKDKIREAEETQRQLDENMNITFYVKDLNGDGDEELLALGSWWYAQAWSYRDGRLTEIPMPENLLKYNLLSGVTLQSEESGYASHTVSTFYRLNSNYEFEFITGVEWNNGAWNNEGYDTFYLLNSKLDYVREIDDNEYLSILGSY